jgi:transcription initiation factor TFIIIB Brf1 subunit/transcription initiation factor TFIIB
VSILNRISFEEVMKLAKTVWPQETAERISLGTLEIITQAAKEKFSFFTGKSAKGLLGGLFYLSGFRYKAVKTQKELAAQLGTTDVTIRVSYRKWLKEFPNFFPDIIGKFEEDEKHGYSIPSNHNRGKTLITDEGTSKFE